MQKWLASAGRFCISGMGFEEVVEILYKISYNLNRFCMNRIPISQLDEKTLFVRVFLLHLKHIDTHWTATSTIHVVIKYGYAENKRTS
jgi:hypothetical protein